MTKINAYTICSRLRSCDTVSVPGIQKAYGLDYCQAREFLQQLIYRGWVSQCPSGIFYSVRKENLTLRRIHPSEKEALAADLTPDCGLAIACIHKNGGADLEQLTDAVRGEEDTQEAISILLNKNLIYKHENMYFLCVSSRAADALEDIQDIKRRNRLLNRDSGKDAIDKIFHKLFQEEPPEDP